MCRCARCASQISAEPFRLWGGGRRWAFAKLTLSASLVHFNLRPAWLLSDIDARNGLVPVANLLEAFSMTPAFQGNYPRASPSASNERLN